jgi:phage anti-repressor protein
MKDEIMLLDQFSKIAESPEPYPVDFDTAWQWVGYTRKDVALRALQSSFEEEMDYSTLKRNRSDGKPGKPYNAYFLTVDCFKAFCMMAGTDKGKEVRQYYLAIEKKYRELQQRVLNPEFLGSAIQGAVEKAVQEKLALFMLSPVRKRAAKLAREEEIRQEVAAFVQKHLEFTENWFDIAKETDIYAIFKAGCIEKNPIPRYAFHDQLRTDYPQARFGRNKQDVAIWHNVRFRGGRMEV